MKRPKYCQSRDTALAAAQREAQRFGVQLSLAVKKGPTSSDAARRHQMAALRSLTTYEKAVSCFLELSLQGRAGSDAMTELRRGRRLEQGLEAMTRRYRRISKKLY